ncbi:MAG: RNA-binding protein [Saprospiraceae bacterium]|nr:MAG: rnp-1 like RNA-binding protein [Bacteroidetes bacterium OLB9]MCO6462668.1 RNA-binding protein [Saprospiraceae bacterium]MCZ2337703.1 RNA-binding protein [Chitinophagales bacterium]
MNIFVTKLNYRTTSEALENLFAEYGEVKSAKVITDRETGRSKGYGFVEMASEDAGMAAIVGLNETEFEGQTIICKKAEPRPERPFNRGGGGYQDRGPRKFNR